MLVVGVFATGIIYLVFNNFVDRLFQSTLLVGFMLLVTGVILQLTRIVPGGRKNKGEIKPKDAVWVGILQAVAIIPGISRSGSTILASLWRGLNRETAVKFSFMLAAPIILAGTLLEIRQMVSVGIEQEMLINYLVGGLAAFLAGIFAIRVFIKLLSGQKLHYFSYYCWAAGLVVIIFSLLN
jgi:undecaprenyl-diphosphatase